MKAEVAPYRSPLRHVRLLAPTEREPMHTESQVRPVGLSNREDFAELARRVRDRGLLGRRRGYYAIKIAATIAGLGLLVAGAILVGNSWWNLGTAVGLAFVLVQLGFIGHDAGHRQICASRRERNGR